MYLLLSSGKFQVNINGTVAAATDAFRHTILFVIGCWFLFSFLRKWCFGVFACGKKHFYIRKHFTYFQFKYATNCSRRRTSRKRRSELPIWARDSTVRSLLYFIFGWSLCIPNEWIILDRPNLEEMDSSKNGCSWYLTAMTWIATYICLKGNFWCLVITDQLDNFWEDFSETKPSMEVWI